jgi:hypothetical protein
MSGELTGTFKSSKFSDTLMRGRISVKVKGHKSDQFECDVDVKLKGWIKNGHSEKLTMLIEEIKIDGADFYIGSVKLKSGQNIEVKLHKSDRKELEGIYISQNPDDKGFIELTGNHCRMM